MTRSIKTNAAFESSAFSGSSKLEIPARHDGLAQCGYLITGAHRLYRQSKLKFLQMSF